MLREPSGLLHPAKICLAAKIGRSEMGEGPTNPMLRRTRPTKPLPEPVDATFPVLLQEAAQSGPRQRRAWAQLIDHLIAGERMPSRRTLGKKLKTTPCKVGQRAMCR
jgi:hypothetical protein